jgi:hypothetical protein
MKATPSIILLSRFEKRKLQLQKLSAFFLQWRITVSGEAVPSRKNSDNQNITNRFS